MESITGLWAEFAELIFTFNFLWVVVATTITMEVLKWTVLSSHMNKRWYPLVVLGVVAFWVLLKTIFTGDWREIVGNLVFTVMMADVVYTYCGQYIMKGLLYVFKAITGNRGNIDNEPKP